MVGYSDYLKTFDQPTRNHYKVGKHLTVENGYFSVIMSNVNIFCSNGTRTLEINTNFCLKDLTPMEYLDTVCLCLSSKQQKFPFRHTLIKIN